ncbi:MAG TPA: hypothetical protein GXX49_10340 [Clostridiaceae bacterium]|nr:hypothetical protein [Clostridiaceae bacterium]
MKKILAGFLIAFILIFISGMALAASVTPQLIDGNDIDKADEITPEGCIFYSFGNNEDPGTYTVRFDCEGNVDPNGSLIFSITIGTRPGDSFTSVLSWESNFEVYAVTVKGGPNSTSMYMIPQPMTHTWLHLM